MNEGEGREREKRKGEKYYSRSFVSSETQTFYLNKNLESS